MSSISSSSLEQQLEQILDLLSDGRDYTYICKELSISRSKLNQRINKLALLMYDRNTNMEDIISITRLKETKIKSLIVARQTQNLHRRNVTLVQLMQDIDKKQNEIITLQHKIVEMFNDEW